MASVIQTFDNSTVFSYNTQTLSEEVLNNTHLAIYPNDNVVIRFFKNPELSGSILTFYPTIALINGRIVTIGHPYDENVRYSPAETVDLSQLSTTSSVIYVGLKLDTTNPNSPSTDFIISDVETDVIGTYVVKLCEINYDSTTGTYSIKQIVKTWFDIVIQAADAIRASIDNEFTGTLYYAKSFGTAIKFDPDVNFYKAITIDDGFGNFNISSNIDGNGNFILSNHGAARITLNTESQVGNVKIFVTDLGTAGSNYTTVNNATLEIWPSSVKYDGVAFKLKSTGYYACSFGNSTSNNCFVGYNYFSEDNLNGVNSGAAFIAMNGYQQDGVTTIYAASTQDASNVRNRWSSIKLFSKKPSSTDLDTNVLYTPYKLTWDSSTGASSLVSNAFNFSISRINVPFRLTASPIIFDVSGYSIPDRDTFNPDDSTTFTIRPNIQEAVIIVDPDVHYYKKIAVNNGVGNFVISANRKHVSVTDTATNTTTDYIASEIALYDATQANNHGEASIALNTEGVDGEVKITVGSKAHTAVPSGATGDQVYIPNITKNLHIGVDEVNYNGRAKFDYLRFNYDLLTDLTTGYNTTLYTPLFTFPSNGRYAYMFNLVLSNLGSGSATYSIVLNVEDSAGNVIVSRTLSTGSINWTDGNPLYGGVFVFDIPNDGLYPGVQYKIVFSGSVIALKLSRIIKLN